jgi:glutamate racemase
VAERPILVFDSGVGGLSVLAEIRALLPEWRVIYCADNAGFPYGAKTDAELNARVPALLGRLAERYAPAVAVIACNTASTIALATVRSVLNLPVVGTVPAIKPAAALTKSKVIGVLGTPATVRQAYVDNLEREFASDCKVLRHGTAELAALAEAELRGESQPLAAYREALAGLFRQPEAAQMDTVVLACTHFPLVREQLDQAMAPKTVQWVDSGAGIARRTRHLLAGQQGSGAGQSLALFTRDDSNLAALAPALARNGLPRYEIL